MMARGRFARLLRFAYSRSCFDKVRHISSGSDTNSQGLNALHAPSTGSVSAPELQGLLQANQSIHVQPSVDAIFDTFHEQAKKYVQGDEVASMKLAFRFYIDSERSEKLLLAKRSAEDAKRSAEDAKRLAEESAQIWKESGLKLVASKEETIVELRKANVKLEYEFLTSEARTKAILGNRIVFELSLMSYSTDIGQPTASFTNLFERIRNSKIVIKQGAGYNLREPCKSWLTELENYGIVTKERNVVSELNDLYHGLSSKVHHSDKLSTSASSGIYIGGEQPITSALAITMLTLQSEGFCPLTLHVLNEQYQPKCTLSGGKISQVISAESHVVIPFEVSHLIPRQFVAAVL